jgi:hypothetical protein
MAAKLKARAPEAVAQLLLATCLVLAATVASARPLKTMPSEGDGVESLAGDIETVVGIPEHDGAGDRGEHKFLSIDMLGGIKDSGPSPGAGH